jgi:hypothetical protein
MIGKRVGRRLGFGRSPLRRRTDRIEGWLTLAVAALLLIAGPFAVWRASASAYGAAVAAAQREKQAPGFQVTAVLQDDPMKYLVADGDGPAQQGAVPARWTGPDGSVHSGQIVPMPGSRSGGAVVISTDRHGNLFTPPTPPDPLWSALGTGIGVGLGLLCAAGVVLLVIRRILNRRRMSNWQMEWLLVERRWSGRR